MKSLKARDDEDKTCLSNMLAAVGVSCSVNKFFHLLAV